MAIGLDDPPATDRRATFLVTCALLAFVVFVPHRYLAPYDNDLSGQVVVGLRYVPFLLSLLLISVVLLRAQTWSVPRHIRVAVLIWLGLTALSGVGSELPYQAIARDVYYSTTGIFLCFVGVEAFKERGSVGAVTLVFLSAGLGLLGIYEFVSGYHPWPGVFSRENARYLMFAPEGSFGRRVVGTIGHPVYLGSFLVLVIPLSLWTVFQTSGIRRVLSVGGAILIFAGLLLTFSRGAWLGGAVGCLVYLRHRSSKQVWAVGLALLVLLTVGLSRDGVWSTLESRGTIGQLRRFKTDQRGIAYLQSMETLSGRPLLGVGTGLYQFAGRSVGDQDRTMDNMYLRLISEHGVAGFSAFVFLLWGVCGILRRASKLGDACENDLCRAVLGCVLGFLVDMVTCDALYFDATRIGFWIVVGLGLASAGRVLKEDVC